MTMDSVLKYPPALNRVHGRGGVTMGMYRTGDSVARIMASSSMNEKNASCHETTPYPCPLCFT